LSEKLDSISDSIENNELRQLVDAKEESPIDRGGRVAPERERYAGNDAEMKWETNRALPPVEIA